MPFYSFAHGDLAYVAQIMKHLSTRENESEIWLAGPIEVRFQDYVIGVLINDHDDPDNSWQFVPKVMEKRGE